MGGIGSRRRWRWDSRPVVEAYPSLDVRWLQRKGMLQIGTLAPVSWTDGTGNVIASITLMVLGGDVVHLSHAVSGREGQQEPASESVATEWTACHYGGRRPWFICPGSSAGVICGRRVAILHRAGRYFLCRHCYGLAYQSQSRGEAGRLMGKARRIRMRLGGSANLSESFPPKPKWLRWRTYWHRRSEAEEANLACWEELDKKLGVRSGAWTHE